MEVVDDWEEAQSVEDSCCLLRLTVREAQPTSESEIWRKATLCSLNEVNPDERAEKRFEKSHAMNACVNGEFLLSDVSAKSLRQLRNSHRVTRATRTISPK